MRHLNRPWARIGASVALIVLVVALLWWQGPDWRIVYHAFDFVRWRWIVGAVALNLASVIVRAAAWQLVIEQALPAPVPRFLRTFSAFCVGLLGNAVLPGRIGEIARVAVLRRRLRMRGSSVTLLGTVFAHRLFDLIPVVLLVLYVLLTAKIPNWAIPSLLLFAAIGGALFAFAMASARRHRPQGLEGLGRIRSLLLMARGGLQVMNRPLPALGAVLLQITGWVFQLVAVYAVMEAFSFDVHLPAAGLVLLLMNIATIFPLWPGNIGLLQAAVALPLVQYGIAYSSGFAFALVLQAVEVSVGVGVGLIFLAREGLSFATLRDFPTAPEALADEALEPRPEEPSARASVPG